MNVRIEKDTAQKIVETVKDVCGHNINYIDTDGIIFASTDYSRIGTFHEVGKTVANTKKTIEVENDDKYYGTKKGVNMPFFYNEKILAVIGISGVPDEVRKYANLALKITKIVLTEQEMESINYKNKNERNFVVKSIIDGNFSNFEGDFTLLDKYGVIQDENYTTALIRPESKSVNASTIENDIVTCLEMSNSKLFTFQYPNNYILITPTKYIDSFIKSIIDLYGKYPLEISIGIGKSESIHMQNISYGCAKLACNASLKKKSIVFFNQLDLEILLGAIPNSIKKEYLDKVLGFLSKEDIEILSAYYSSNMSLKEASDKMYIHKNTLQYNLNKIMSKCGYNPRDFSDAVILYLAILISKY